MMTLAANVLGRLDRSWTEKSADKYGSVKAVQVVQVDIELSRNIFMGRGRGNPPWLSPHPPVCGSRRTKQPGLPRLLGRTPEKPVLIDKSGRLLACETSS